MPLGILSSGLAESDPSGLELANEIDRLKDTPGKPGRDSRTSSSKPSADDTEVYKVKGGVNDYRSAENLPRIRPKTAAPQRPAGNRRRHASGGAASQHLTPWTASPLPPAGAATAGLPPGQRPAP
jgi:hypothetical protein